MTQDETIKVLELLNAYYAGGKNDPKQQVVAWHLILQKYDFDDAMAAVLRFVEDDTRSYASFPGVGLIVNEIKAEARRRESYIAEIIRMVGYGNDYSCLSDEAKALIPETSYAKWLAIDAEEFASKQSTFADFLRKRRLALESGSEDCNTH
jgi:phosphoenolpyruvate carboxylase